MSETIIDRPSLPEPFVQRGGRQLRVILGAVHESWTAKTQQLEPAALFGAAHLECLAATAGLSGLFRTVRAERGVAHASEARHCVLLSLRGIPVALGDWLHALHGVELVELTIDDAPGALGSEAPSRVRIGIRCGSDADREAVTNSIRELLRADVELEKSEIIWRTGA